MFSFSCIISVCIYRKNNKKKNLKIIKRIIFALNFLYKVKFEENRKIYPYKIIYSNCYLYYMTYMTIIIWLIYIIYEQIFLISSNFTFYKKYNSKMIFWIIFRFFLLFFLYIRTRLYKRKKTCTYFIYNYIYLHVFIRIFFTGEYMSRIYT